MLFKSMDTFKVIVVDVSYQHCCSFMNHETNPKDSLLRCVGNITIVW